MEWRGDLSAPQCPWRYHWVGCIAVVRPAEFDASQSPFMRHILTEWKINPEIVEHTGPITRIHSEIPRFIGAWRRGMVELKLRISAKLDDSYVETRRGLCRNLIALRENQKPPRRFHATVKAMARAWHARGGT